MDSVFVNLFFSSFSCGMGFVFHRQMDICTHTFLGVNLGQYLSS
jgi:hypothetical protein